MVLYSSDLMFLRTYLCSLVHGKNTLNFYDMVDILSTRSCPSTDVVHVLHFKAVISCFSFLATQVFGPVCRRMKFVTFPKMNSLA